MDKNAYLSTVQLAKLLGISRIAVFKKIKNGQIKASKVGRNYVIDRNDVRKLLGGSLDKAMKQEIDQAVNKTVKEYGETLRLLANEEK